MPTAVAAVTLTIDEALQEAIAHHRAGRLQDAERLYRAILQVESNHPDANHNLGVLAVGVGEPEAALSFLKAALETNPQQRQFWINYLNALIKANRVDDARKVLDQGKKAGLSGDAISQIEQQLMRTGAQELAGEAIKPGSLRIKVPGPKKASKKKGKNRAIRTDKNQPKLIPSLAPTQEEIDSLLRHYNAGALDIAEKLALSMTQRFPSHPFGWKAYGVILKQIGLLHESIRAMEEAIRLSPNDAQVHSNLGVVLNDLGRLADAETSCREAIRLKPDLADAYSNLGNALKDLGRPAEAETSYREAIRLKPDFADAHGNLGVVLMDLGQFTEAEASCREAIRLKHNYANAHSNLANALKYLGRLAEAEASYRETIRLKPDFAEAHSNLGVVLKDMGRLADAEASYREAIRLKPDFTEAHCNLGNTLRELGRFAEAEASCGEAIRLKPDYVEAHIILGNALKDLGRLAETEASYREAIRLKPDLAELHCNLGVVLQDLGRLAEAEASCREAIRLKPEFADAQGNLGAVLTDIGRFTEAEASYREAIRLKHNYANAHLNLALLLLLRGQYDQGWDLYEWRWKRKDSMAQRLYKQPLWLGNDDISGKSILVYPEQGLGDFIQFIRYVRLLEQYGASVILEVPPQLSGLISTMSGNHRMIRKEDSPQDFDYHCPLLSLPNAFKTTLDTIPCHISYLSAPADRRLVWKERLGSRTKPRIGLAWSGSIGHKNDHNRSIPLSMLESLVDLPFEFHSLQKDVRPQDQATLSTFTNIHPHQDEIEDFSDTAALIEWMDVVISVDTSVAHVAGAMGKPVWILLPLACDWRWLLDRSDCPWYPTATLFRQPAIGDWKNALSRVGEALCKAYLMQ